MNFDNLLIHPKTKAELAAMCSDAPHALLFIAPAGTGKLTVAKAWASKLTTSASTSVLAPEESGSISIDSVRGLYKSTRSRQAGRQIVIIDQAEAMGVESQNAFLKLLEEPRLNLTFVLTLASKEGVLPTIISRAQCVYLQPIAADLLAEYTRQKNPQISQQELAQMLFIANGRPGTLARILDDAGALELQKSMMQRAKILLGASRYERLAQISSLTKDKTELIATLDAMARMLSIQLQSTNDTNLLAFAERLNTCMTHLRQNGNPRAQLVHLFAL